MIELNGQITAKKLSGKANLVPGSSGGGGGELQSKTVTPTDEQQIVTPDDGYYGLSSVTVNSVASELIASPLTDMDSGKYEEPIVDLEFYTYEKDTATIANRGVLGVAGNATVTLNSGSAYYKNNDGYGDGIILTKNANFTVPTDLFENAITSVYTWIIKVENYVHQSSKPNYARISRSNKDVPSIFYYYARQAFCAKLAANTTTASVISYNPDIVTVHSDTGITFPIALKDVLAFTCDGSVIRFYINGVEVMSMLRSKMTVTDVVNIGCGDTSNTSAYYFESIKISKFLLYNRCLSAEELQGVI